jgi:6-phosphogluconolactonase
MSERKVLLFENSHTLTNYLLKEWVRIVERSVSDHGKCTVALSGGKTPVEFYARLSHLEDFNLWPKVHLFQVDERYVERDDRDSNWRTIRENLLSFIPLPPANLHPIPTRHENVLVATEDYKHQLLFFFNVRPQELPRFDLIILGCGEDGHVGSLHPQLEYLEDPNRLCVPVTDAYFKQERISLSLATINNARHIMVMLQGERKASVVKRVLEDGEELPVAKVNAREGELTFLIDRFAASQLSKPARFTDQGEAISI